MFFPQLLERPRDERLRREVLEQPKRRVVVALLEQLSCLGNRGVSGPLLFFLALVRVGQLLHTRLKKKRARIPRLQRQ